MNLGSFPVFSLTAPPSSKSPPPFRGLFRLRAEGTVANAAHFTATLSFTAVWPDRVSRALLPHWLCGPAHGALRQCGWRCCWGRVLGVSGGSGTMDVGELLSYQVWETRRAGRPAAHLGRGRRTGVPSSYLFSPQSRAWVPSLLMPLEPELLISLLSPGPVHLIPSQGSGPFLGAW